MAATWIVVADSDRARIFDTARARGPLREIESLEPDGHGGIEDEALPRFARDVAAHLEAHRAQGRFDRFFVAGTPHVLGYLRDALSPGTAAVLLREFAEDWSALTAEAIRERLPARIG